MIFQAFPAPGGRHGPVRSLPRFPLILSAAVFISVAQAQAPPDDDDDDSPAAMPAPERLGMERINIDQWVFEGHGNYAGARQRLNSMLALHVEGIDRACKLTEAQKKKLQLLGRGDINRFFDRYEKLKQKFELVKRDEQRMNDIWQDIQPLQMALQGGLFESESLLVKGLHHTLLPEQEARYDAMVRERRAFHHRAGVEVAVTVLEKGMPLREAQRRELVTLLLKATKPPRKSSQYDNYILMIQIGRLPEEKLKPLFDNAQWQVVSRQLGQYKGAEQHFKRMGLLPDEENEPERAEPRPAAQKK